MPAPGKYSDKLREWATRLAPEAIAAERQWMAAVGDPPGVAGRLDVHPEVLRMWGKRAEIDGTALLTVPRPSGSLRGRIPEPSRSAWS